MRGIWLWLAACVVGLLVLIGVVAAVGNADNSNKTVPAADWADRACGGIATWRGEMEAIVDSVRSPASLGQSAEEPQSEHPRHPRRGAVEANPLELGRPSGAGPRAGSKLTRQ